MFLHPNLPSPWGIYILNSRKDKIIGVTEGASKERKKQSEVRIRENKNKKQT